MYPTTYLEKENLKHALMYSKEEFNASWKITNGTWENKQIDFYIISRKLNSRNKQSIVSLNRTDK